MTTRDARPRLADIVDAVEHIHAALDGATYETFNSAWDKRWLVERGFEIISEASSHLPVALKARNPEVPWGKVAGIGNILRHEYQRVAPDILRATAHENLPLLEKVCRAAPVAERAGESDD